MIGLCNVERYSRIESPTVVHENFGFCFVFLRYVECAFMWLITETFYYLIYIRKCSLIQRILNINYYFVSIQVTNWWIFFLSYVVWLHLKFGSEYELTVAILLEMEGKEICNHCVSHYTLLNNPIWWCNGHRTTGHWALDPMFICIESKSQITIVSYSMLWLDFQIQQQNTFKLSYWVTADRFCIPDHSFIICFANIIYMANRDFRSIQCCVII